MTKDELIRMAIECQLVTTGNRDGLYMEALEKFAAIVCAKAKADECKECAKVCADIGKDMTSMAQLGASQCESAIRARGQV